MNPYGLVAAAATTSHTSNPIRSQSTASWLTSAMFTFLNTFSSSFAISAAAGDESFLTGGPSCSKSRAARRVLSSSIPPTMTGVLCIV